MHDQQAWPLGLAFQAEPTTLPPAGDTTSPAAARVMGNWSLPHTCCKVMETLRALASAVPSVLSMPLLLVLWLVLWVLLRTRQR